MGYNSLIKLLKLPIAQLTIELIFSVQLSFAQESTLPRAPFVEIRIIKQWQEAKYTKAGSSLDLILPYPTPFPTEQVYRDPTTFLAIA